MKAECAGCMNHRVQPAALDCTHPQFRPLGDWVVRVRSAGSFSGAEGLQGNLGYLRPWLNKANKQVPQLVSSIVCKFLLSVLGAECRASYSPGKHSATRSIPTWMCSTVEMWRASCCQDYGILFFFMLLSPFIPCLYFLLTQLDISLNKSIWIGVMLFLVPLGLALLVETDPGIREHWVTAEWGCCFQDSRFRSLYRHVCMHKYKNSLFPGFYSVQTSKREFNQRSSQTYYQAGLQGRQSTGQVTGDTGDKIRSVN